MSGLPEWAEDFEWGLGEIEVTVCYQPESFDDAVGFLRIISGYADGRIIDVRRV